MLLVTYALLASASVYCDLRNRDCNLYLGRNGALQDRFRADKVVVTKIGDEGTPANVSIIKYQNSYAIIRESFTNDRSTLVVPLKRNGGDWMYDTCVHVCAFSHGFVECNWETMVWDENKTSHVADRRQKLRITLNGSRRGPYDKEVAESLKIEILELHYFDLHTWLFAISRVGGVLASKICRGKDSDCHFIRNWLHRYQSRSFRATANDSELCFVAWR
ncbi:hypothetical protein [Paraburkholderia rhizosphaerae]|uniref:hypothetical protein n=1 Tax=Paraburkholderia rhizosphaerae TaxID=480658 RepID=UPI0010671536|nr:hypothetical protein [Paraburkholderia rhizosphaerae]